MVEAGVDAVGFVVEVPQSPRNLSMDEAEALIEATPVFVETVVVTVPENLTSLEKICSVLNPDALQIHGLSFLGSEIKERFPHRRLIGAIQCEKKLDVNTFVDAADAFDAILLDSYDPTKHGGTGKIHDWKFGKRVRESISKPLILAGGLRPDNVGVAVKMVKPYAVDVSSGVELSPGIKDRRKVLKFLENVKGNETYGTE